MSPFVNNILHNRLTALGCERLPQFVIRNLRARIDLAVAQAIARIVEREVSSAKIARIFVRGPEPSARRQGGFEGDAASGPFDQSGLLELHPQFEPNPVTGTAAQPTTSPL